MRFLSDEWLKALNHAAAARIPADDEDGGDPLAAVSLVVEQRVEDVVAWRMLIHNGTVTVRRSDDGDPEPDVRLTCSEAVARAIASGQRPALDAFIDGELRIGGDVSQLLAHRAALETMGDLFATVQAQITFN